MAPPLPKPPVTLRTIVALAGPAIAGLLLQTGVLWADRVMLGHYGGAGGSGASALAAMQLAGPVEWTLVSITSAFSVGTLALVGRAVGAGDHDAARRHTTGALVVALALGALVTLAAYALILPGLPLAFPHAGHSLVLARDYLRAALLAAPFYCVGMAGFAALSASGDTVTPLKIGVLVNVVHIAINWLLIGGHGGFPALGVQGAGISTAFSYAAEAVLTVAALARVHGAATFRPFVWPFRGTEGRAALRSLYELSVPATLERVVYHVAYMTFVWMIARLGDDAMGANQALIAIEAISFMTVDGFATACGALVAQELGAGRPERAAWVGWATTGLAIATLSTFGLGFFLLRHQLPALVTPKLELQVAAAQALVVVAIAQPFMAAGVVLGQAVRGAGAVRVALLVSLFGGFIVRLLATWIATSRGLGVTGVWLGSTCDWATRALLLAWVWRAGLYRLDRPSRAR